MSKSKWTAFDIFCRISRLMVVVILINTAMDTSELPTWLSFGVRVLGIAIYWSLDEKVWHD